MTYNLPLRSILILSSYLRLGLPKGLFPVGLPVKILKALLTSSILATGRHQRSIVYSLGMSSFRKSINDTSV